MGWLCLQVIAQPGFYAQLEPFPGAVEALQKMVQVREGHGRCKICLHEEDTSFDDINTWHEY